MSDLLKNYIREKGGKRVLQKILIANNGIAAIKGIRSIRKWSYETLGHDKIFHFVVMATPEDLKSNAEYIKLADNFVEVNGGSNANNYANIALIVEIAEQNSCDAVWAGWGHASENDQLPEALLAAGITWVGPSPEAMRALGDKIGSTLIAQSTGMDVLPWSGSGINIQYKTDGISKEIYNQACIKDPEDAKKCARKIGLPAMIKASAGGGGKGIRKLESLDKAEEAFRQVSSEVAGPIFMMKLVRNCRHLEVQIIADERGNAMALYGRDCSLQRRHQKIVEEGPVCEEVCPREKWAEMEKAAVKLCEEVSYVGAGTVEYLYSEDGTYCFLELNPRLQVEHPVSELITGVNLPATQLLIAMGVPLHEIPPIRVLYGQLPEGTGNFDFYSPKIRPSSHIIACRITAENPDKDFTPTSGLIQSLHFRSTQDVWGYFSVDSKGSLHEYADSQFGHLFSQGKDRESARKKMVLALSELLIRGEIRTTVECLRMILEAKDYKENRLSTMWLETKMKEKFEDHIDLATVIVSGAVFRAVKHFSQSKSEILSQLKMGRYFIQTPLLEAQTVFETELFYADKKFLFRILRRSKEVLHVQLLGAKGEQMWEETAKTRNSAQGGLLVSFGGFSHVVYGRETASGLMLTVNGCTRLFQVENDPSQIRSAIPGTLVRFVAKNGEKVEKEQVVAEIEVMKIVIPVISPETGIIETQMSEGDIISVGDVIAKLAFSEKRKTKKTTLFEGNFPTTPKNISHEKKPKSFKTLQNCVEILTNALKGYKTENIPSVVKTFYTAVQDPTLAYQELSTEISNLRSRFPPDLYAKVMKNVDKGLSLNAEKRLKSSTGFNANCGVQNGEKLESNTNHLIAIEKIIGEYVEKLSEEARRQTKKTFSSLKVLFDKFRRGSLQYGFSIVLDLLSVYTESESPFKYDLLDESLSEICKNEHKKTDPDFENVRELLVSHVAKKTKSKVVSALIDYFGHHFIGSNLDFLGVERVFQKLVELIKDSDCEEMADKSRRILLELRKKSLNAVLLSDVNVSIRKKNDGFRIKIEFLSNYFRSKTFGALETDFKAILDDFQLFLLKEKYASQPKNNAVLIETTAEKHFLSFLGIKNLLNSLKPTLRLLQIEAVGCFTPEERKFFDNQTSQLWCLAQDPFPLKSEEVIKSGDADGELILPKKRLLASKLKTSYAADFLTFAQNGWESLMAEATKLRGEKTSASPSTPHQIEKIKITQLVVGTDTTTKRRFLKKAHYNRNHHFSEKSGILVWKLTLKDPFFLTKRKILLIANDITNRYGSTSPSEGEKFCLATKMARAKKWPLIYISANSGARIGFAMEIWDKIRLCAAGGSVDYIYLCESDYRNQKAFVECSRVFNESEGDFVYKIDAIIGEQRGIGVENLCASGAMASEMAQAYGEVFTVSYVTGRAVGIGAYLVRLGKRVIQQKDSPILLTGSDAINKLLGDQIYTSNIQLGGPRIMSFCGITQLVVENDLEGMKECLRWTFYSTNQTLMATQSLRSLGNNCGDSVKRRVKLEFTNETMDDPRKMVRGECNGIFDEGSFKEYTGDWARSVVAGRARLGGIPIGVISPEMRVTETAVPADPALPGSRETLSCRAGQIWFPDSSHKTAEAIETMARENLPIFFLGNWRGFSGGMRDMFDQVIKFGAEIVYALKKCKLPVFVYLPPYAELRGGSWVVLDTNINPGVIEMYASDLSRGGIMEPQGLINVKLKKDKILGFMKKSDNTLKELYKKYSLKTEHELLDQIKEREKLLFPLYRKATVKFADLHDRPERMLRVGAIRRIVKMEESRHFFYLRLRWKLLEYQMITSLSQVWAYKSENDCIPILAGFIQKNGGDIGQKNAEENFAHLENLFFGKFGEFLAQQRGKSIKEFVKKISLLGKQSVIKDMESE